MISRAFAHYVDFVLSEDGPMAGLLIVCFLLGLLILETEKRGVR